MGDQQPDTTTSNNPTPTTGKPYDRAIAAGWTRHEAKPGRAYWLRVADDYDTDVVWHTSDGWAVEPPQWAADNAVRLRIHATEAEALDDALAAWGVA